MIRQQFRAMATARDAVSSKASAVFTKLRVGPMKRLYKYYTPTAINLAGGVPMERIFPFESIDVKLSDGSNVHLNKGANLSMNYLRGDGIGELKDWINGHLASVHKPQVAYQSCMTVGSTDAFAKILTLLNGDSVLFDKFAYGASVNASRTLGRIPIGVQMDADGMIPESLREVTILARRQGLNPDVVYLVPTAQNPTGITMPEERKRAIYQVCSELDLAIVEDDAYYYLHFGEPKNDSLEALPGVKDLPKSFFSMDTDGRVIRVDSLSKFIAPGMRLGWITGPDDFIQKYLLLQEMTTQFPSGLSQSVFAAVLKQWGDAGFDHHIRLMQAHYLKQRDFMHNALVKHLQHLPSSMISFNKPTGGMFLWLTLSVGPASEELFKSLAAAGVITVPGGDFQVPTLLPRQATPGYRSLSGSSGCGSSSSSSCGEGGCGSRGDADPNFESPVDPPIVRLTYAAATQQQIEDGVKRLADGLQTVLNQKK